MGAKWPDNTPRRYAAERLSFYASALGLGEGSATPSCSMGFRSMNMGSWFKRPSGISKPLRYADNTSLFIRSVGLALLAARVQARIASKAGCSVIPQNGKECWAIFWQPGQTHAGRSCLGCCTYCWRWFGFGGLLRSPCQAQFVLALQDGCATNNVL